MFLISRLSFLILILAALALTFSAFLFQCPKVVCHRFGGDFVVTANESNAALSNITKSAIFVTSIEGNQPRETPLDIGQTIEHPIPRWHETTYFSNSSMYTVTREPVLFTDAYIASFTFLISCLIATSAYIFNIVREFLKDSRHIYIQYSDTLVELESAKRMSKEGTKCKEEIIKENECLALHINIIELGDKHLTSGFAESIREKIRRNTVTWIKDSKTKNQRHAEVRNLLESRLGILRLVLGK